MAHHLQSRASAWIAGATVALAGTVAISSSPARRRPRSRSRSASAWRSPVRSPPTAKCRWWPCRSGKTDINAKGGLLGRPVKLVYYDDQSNPSQVPGIYTKLLDIDKVDLIVSGYASGQIAPAMPIAIQKKKLFVSLFGTGINETFKYSKIFLDDPERPDAEAGLHARLLQGRRSAEAEAADDRDRDGGRRIRPQCLRGCARERHEVGLQDRLRKSYPPSTTDFSPIVRAVQAANPDLFVVCSYPLDTVGMVNAMHEVGFKPKMWGGAMVGLQATVFKTKLGPLLNGVVNYETWLPVKSMEFPGSMELLKKYQERAKAAGTDPLGYYMPVWAYA